MSADPEDVRRRAQDIAERELFPRALATDAADLLPMEISTCSQRPASTAWWDPDAGGLDADSKRRTASPKCWPAVV